MRIFALYRHGPLETSPGSHLLPPCRFNPIVGATPRGCPSRRDTIRILAPLSSEALAAYSAEAAPAAKAGKEDPSSVALAKEDRRTLPPGGRSPLCRP